MASTRKTVNTKGDLTETPVEQPKAEETEQQKRNRLRNEAEREVLNNHRDEFHRVAEEKFKAAGLEYRRRLSAEEKAEKDLERLLAEHPHLRGKVTLNESDG